MRKIVFLTLGLVLLSGVQQAAAQGTRTAARPQPTPTPTPARSQTAANQPVGGSATGNVPATKIAVIFSADFQNPKGGIARYIVTMNKLNAEFLPLQNELSATKQRLNQQQTEIKNNTNLTPAQLQAKIDQFDRQNKEYTRKGEDAQAAYQKRRNELLGPLQDEVGRALDAYGQSHGITMIIDGSRMPILYAADSTDITKAFIAEYNSKNPATATTTPPKP
jgi:Skp family chaperone for outer membrane proteins